MKKLFFSLVAATIAATAAFAQSSVLATLTHDGKISTYYGSTALKSAHNAAQHGDVITLSSGTFNAVDITKAVTIRGAGMQTDSVSKIYATSVVGAFKIDVADSLETNLTVEGVNFDNNEIAVYHTLKNATFIKNRFYTFKSVGNSTNGWGYMKNVAFVHCKFARHFANNNGSNSVSFVNSVLMNPVIGNSNYTTNSFELTNCIVNWWSDYYPGNNSFYAIYRNCILITDRTSGNYKLSTTNLLYNCLAIATKDILADYSSLSSTMFYKSTNMANVFKSWTGPYSNMQNYELTENAKAMYLGDDGKEVGIYGGNLPYTAYPSNPKITKFNVASKSTADGKLSVDIEVKAAE